MNQATTLDKVSRWRMFRAYWDIGILWRNDFYNISTRSFYVKTLLFGLRLEYNVPDFMNKMFFSGVRLDLFPHSWKFKIQEGASLYRHSWKWGKFSPWGQMKPLNEIKK